MKQVVVVAVVVVVVNIVVVIDVIVIVVVVVVNVVAIVVVRDFEPEGNQSSRKSQPTKMNHKNLKMILCNATKKTFCKKTSIPVFSISAPDIKSIRFIQSWTQCQSFNVHSLQCLEITCE